MAIGGVCTGGVGVVLDPDSIRIFRVSKNRNRPVLMVGSSGSGPSGFGLVSVRFRVSPLVPIFRRIGLDLADIWLDLSNLE